VLVSLLEVEFDIVGTSSGGKLALELITIASQTWLS